MRRRKKLIKVINFCRKHQYDVSTELEQKLLEELKTAYEAVVKRDLEKQEQARIKAQIREEKQAEIEKQKALERIEAEKKAIQEALANALRETHEEHNAIIDSLKAQLAEAEERSQRAISQAQLTRSGYVYVISNHGSFGENVFKIGMTRRLEPLDRIKELGDASVPFPFDVHMMISCDDAPKLESVLHSKLHQNRLNKINLRKEYFRSDIHVIAKIVEQHHGVVEYIADPEAFEYRESLNMSSEDFEFITEAVGTTAAVGDDEDE